MPGFLLDGMEAHHRHPGGCRDLADGKVISRIHQCVGDEIPAFAGMTRERGCRDLAVGIVVESNSSVVSVRGPGLRRDDGERNDNVRPEIPAFAGMTGSPG